jgi:hypothetical protein
MQSGLSDIIAQNMQSPQVIAMNIASGRRCAAVRLR